jgi:hypothetical protein
MSNFLVVRLRLPEQRFQPRLQILCRRGVKAVIHLAGIDQILSLPPAKINAVELVAVERITRDRQRLALVASNLDPVLGPGRDVGAIANLRYDAFQACRAGVLVHLLAIDLETLAELNCGIGD